MKRAPKREPSFVVSVLRRIPLSAYRKFRKRVMIPVLIKSANMAPMMGTMRKGTTVEIPNT